MTQLRRRHRYFRMFVWTLNIVIVLGMVVFILVGLSLPKVGAYVLSLVPFSFLMFGVGSSIQIALIITIYGVANIIRLSHGEDEVQPMF